MKKRVSGILFSALVGLIFLEIGLRLFGPFKQAGKTPDNILWQPDTQIGFAPAANLDTVVYSAEWMSRMITNEFGFRTARAVPVVKRPTSESILFLGDSQTMGEQVPAEFTFVSLVASELARRGLRWRAINAGCNGFNTAQEYLFFKKLYDEGFRPKVVVMYVVNNDLYEDVPGLPYGRYEINDNGYVVSLPPDPESLERLRKAKEIPAPESNFALRHSALLRHLWYLYRIYHNPYDVVDWIKNTYLRDDLDPFAEPRWAIVSATISTLNRLVTSYGGRLIIAVHPDPVEWSDEYYAKLMHLVPELSGRTDRMKLQHGYRRIAADVDVTFIDMLKGFPTVSVRDFRFAMDPHANASGHRIIAQQLLKGFGEVGLLN